MKTLFLIGVFLPSVVLGQELDYERQKLDVQVQNYNTAAVGFYGNIAVAEAGTRKDWYGTRGGRRVSESAFYRTAGLKEEAGMAGGRESGRMAGGLLMGIGVPAMLGGLVGMAVTIEDTSGAWGKWTGVAVGGIVVTVLGGAVYWSNDGNATEAGFAIKVAEIHNQQLRVRLGMER